MTKVVSRAISLILACAMLFPMFCTNASAVSDQSADPSGAYIVENGNPIAAITVPADASDMEKYAAEELQYHVEKVSGTQLPMGLALTASFVESSITAENAGYHPVELLLQNPTEETYTVTIEQTAVQAGLPSLTVRGTNEIDGLVTIAPKTQVTVSGVVYVEDLFAFIEYPLSVQVLSGESELANATLNVISGPGADSLLKNGDFELVWNNAAFNNWQLASDRFAIETTDVHNGSYAVKLTGGGHGYGAFLDTKLNTSYMVSFWAKGAGASLTVRTAERFDGGALVNNTSKTVKLSENWAEYQVAVDTCSGNEGTEYEGLWLNLDAAGAELLLDDIIFAEIPEDVLTKVPQDSTSEETQDQAVAENLLLNGDFENVTDSVFYAWNLKNGGGASYEVEESDVHRGLYALKLTHTTANDDHRYNLDFAIKPSTAYTISFWAKGVTGNDSLAIKTNEYNSAGGLRYYSHATKPSEDWVKYEYTYTTVSNATYLRLHLRVIGTVILDDIAVVETQEQPVVENLLLNGDFEKVSDSVFYAWNLKNGGDARYEIEESDVHSGTYALKLTHATANDDHRYNLDFAIKPSTTYTISFWAKGVTGNDSLAIKTNEYNSAGGLRYYSHATKPSEDWVKYEYTYTTVSNATYLRLHLRVVGTILLDDIAVVEMEISPNLLTNGDFETITRTGSGVVFNGWTYPNGANHWTSLGDVHSGSYAIRLPYVSKDYAYGATIATKPNTNYTVSFWAKGDGATFSIITQEKVNDTWGNKTEYAVDTGADWLQYHIPFKTVDAENYGGLWLNLGVGGALVYLDDISIVETPKGSVVGKPERPEIPAPAASAFNLAVNIVIATPDSESALHDLFADDIAWLQDTGAPGDKERYGDDGFAIRQVDNTLYIFGATPRGALNGVYDFIEENMGVLWTRADEELGLIYKEMPTITADKVNYREKSPFSVRGWHLCGTGSGGEFHSDPATEVMLARNKMNTKLAEPGNRNQWERQSSIGITPFHLTHNVSNWILESPSYDESYVGYWNTDENGNPILPSDPKWDRNHQQINFWDQGSNGYDDGSTGKTLQTVIDGIRQFLVDNPDAEYVGVGIQDIWYCKQANLDDKPFEYAPGKYVDPTADNYLSTVYFSFINKVAKAFPDVTINAFAYLFTVYPPECEIEDNVCVVFAAINEDVTDSLEEATGDSPNGMIKKNLDGWSLKTTNLVTYNYYGCYTPSNSFERPIAEKIQNDMQYFASNGFAGLSPEGVVDAGTYKDTWAMNALTFWLYSKLAWDPYADIDALIEEFCDKSYGAASEYMQEYYAYLQNAWDTGKEGVNLVYNLPLYVYIETFIKDSGFIDEMQAALDNAYNSANDIEKQRIKHIKDTFTENLEFLNRETEPGSAVRTAAAKENILNTIQLADPFADPIWENATVLENFVSTSSMEKIDGKEMTVRLLWDDEYLYVGYENYDSMDNLPVTDFDENSNWWVAACTDVETFIAATPDSTQYAYFTNPKADAFRYYQEFGASPTFDEEDVDWEAATAKFSDRWVAIQAISFESIGINAPITRETTVYANFFRDCGTREFLGWNGAHVWNPLYLSKITLTPGTIQNIAVDVTAPVAGAKKQATVGSGTGYSGTILWDCDTDTFGYNTAYTATVTLTANAGVYKFASDLEVSGWNVIVSEDGAKATLTQTFPATQMEKLTALNAPADTTLRQYCADAAEAIAQLPATITYGTESGSVTVEIEWSYTDYDPAVTKTNEFIWTVKDGELAGYDANDIATSGKITVTNAGAIAVGNRGTDQSITYDGSTYDVADMFTISENAGDASYAIVDGTGAGTLNGSVLTITKAGTFEIRLSTEATGAYAAGETTATLTVNKGVGSCSLAIADWTYGEDANVPDIESITNDAANVTYFFEAVDGKGYTGSVAPRNAGNYKLTVTVAETDLYAECAAEDTFTINKKALSITAENNTIHYGDMPAANGVIGSGFAYDEGMADLTGELTYTYTYEQYHDIGVYKITPAGLSSDNYAITFVDGELIVNAKAITAADVQLDGKLTYTGSEQTQQIIVADGITYEVSGNKATDIGTYELTVKGTGNYTGEVKLNWSICESGPAAVATPPTANELTYNGQDQALIRAGTSVDGKLVYSLSENGVYSDEIPTGKNAGNYTVWYYVQGNGNHADSEKEFVEVSIGKAQLSVTAKDQSITYGSTISGTEIAYAGLLSDHTVTVTLLPSTSNVTANGTIHASAAVFTADGIDVTENYEISYTVGKLVIQPNTSKIDGLTIETVTSVNEDEIKEVQTMMENADSIQDEWAAISANCEDLLEKIEAVRTENRRIENAVSRFNRITMKPSDKATVLQLISDIDAQLATNNLTGAERAKLESLKVKCNSLISQTNITNVVIDRLIKVVKSWIQKIPCLPKWPSANKPQWKH